MKNDRRPMASFFVALKPFPMAKNFPHPPVVSSEVVLTLQIKGGGWTS